MRRRINWSIAAGIVAVLLVSCERRPLSDQVYNVYLDLEIEDDIVNYPLDEHDEWLPERMYEAAFLPAIAASSET